MNDINHQSHGRNQNAYRADIDGLRSVAVILVLLFHVDLSLFAGGYVGVDVFFVISGFLITGLIYKDVVNNEFNFGNFYTRRMRRLYPAMLITVLFVLMFSSILFSPSDLERVGGSSFTALLSVSNIYFWTEKDYFDAASSLKPLLHTWSLGVEEQFYLFWPALIFFGAKLLPHRLFIYFMVFAGLTSFGLSYIFSDKTSALFFLLPARVFEFAIGGILALVAKKIRLNLITSNVLLIAGMAMILYSAIMYSENTPFPFANALAPCLGAAFVILSGSTAKSAFFLRSRIAVYIGKLSYSLYLVHWPIIVFYKYIIEGRELNIVDQAILLLISFVCAVLLHRFVEVRFRYPKKEEGKTPLHGSAFVMSALLFSLPLLAISASIWANHGWLWRLQEGPREIALQRQVALIEKMSYTPLDTPEYRLLLVGDSHAGHYKPLLQDFFRPQNVQVDTLGAACAPLPFAIVYDTGGEMRECTELAEQLLHQTTEYDAIILAARWETYTETDYSPRDSAARHHRRFVSTEGEESRVLTRSKSQASFSRSLELYSAYARDKGVPVLIIGQVPPLGSEHWRCITRPTFGARGECQPYYTRDESLARIQYSEHVFTGLRDDKEIFFISLADLLCPEVDAYCSPYYTNMMIYYDDNHLTFPGSHLIGERLYPQLEAFKERLMN